MSTIYRLRGGGTGLALRVEHLLSLDGVTDVLCRALVKDEGDVDVMDEKWLSKLGRSNVENKLRDELAFGGYEAYGHLWDGNTSGDTDEFYVRVRIRLTEIYPDLEEKES